ncbi:hypothetical protein GCM10027169_35290 [Gordonia jinhuaensis]|uniref:Esterase n=1 Tax=Gordonia jinhuaensis TaxID=1517702 RepID=A0A916T535_9ACTN|nr:alpha/beta hydrolase family protein [Gordonia jinhuaensis]GGB30059.1 hypothetical protein GCM10011489_17840 [Gordonia jinhuaensis]
MTAHTPDSQRPPIIRRSLTLVAVAIVALVAVIVAMTATGGNKATAQAGHPEQLRPSCSWDSSGNYVQNCQVWSKSMGRFVTVQIRASNGSGQGVYLLDGMRATDQRSAWTNDVQAAKVYDGSTDTTLVMPVGGASEWYTDWNGQGPKGDSVKWETFLTSELPDYLDTNFGVSKSNNAIVGVSMSAGPAVNLAERHPSQFKVVQAMSGYYQTDNPIGALGIAAAQAVVSGYPQGILNMWKDPADWTGHDASKNIDSLKKNGQVLIVSSGNAFLSPSEMAKLAPQDQVSAILLEALSAVSTVLFQLQTGQAGVSTINIPDFGGHTWENWGRAIADGKDDVLAGLKNTPAVTQKDTVLAAAAIPATDSPAAKAALKKADASTDPSSSTPSTDAASSGESSGESSQSPSATTSDPADVKKDAAAQDPATTTESSSTEPSTPPSTTDTPTTSDTPTTTPSAPADSTTSTPSSSTTPTCPTVPTQVTDLLPNCPAPTTTP